MIKKYLLHFLACTSDWFNAAGDRNAELNGQCFYIATELRNGLPKTMKENCNNIGGRLFNPQSQEEQDKVPVAALIQLKSQVSIESILRFTRGKIILE